MASLDLTQIQGNILRGYRAEKARFIFLAVPNASAGRGFLAELLPHVHNAADTPRPVAFNVAITFAGLGALGVSDTILASLPAAFREPIRRRAARVLGDTGPSAPDKWDEGLGIDRCHILVAIYEKVAPEWNITADSSEANEIEALYAMIGGHGLEIVHIQPTEVLTNSREHFGWADGLAQPAIEGVPQTQKPGAGTPIKDDGWQPLRTGEFIHGYADEDGPYLIGPAAALLQNGTFMVYRKLHQDVVRFRKHLYEQAQLYGDFLNGESSSDPDFLYELMAAKVVGRWRDGEPIKRSPHREPQTTTHLGDKAIDQPSNDFRYADDADGGRCPIGAHIRRTNPRDGLQGAGASGLMSRRHRIIRRGMPYGEWLERGRPDDGEDRGLIFICFNADFERQFELIQNQWCDDGNAFRLENEQDFLLHRTTNGYADGRVPNQRFTIGGEPIAAERTAPSPPFFASSEADFVLTRGCEYLLMPGIPALRQLVEGHFDDDAGDSAEHQATAEVVQLTKAKLERDFPPGTPMLRDQHAKSHGCVRAEFTVRDDLPPWLRHGIFTEPGTYPAWIRFSSSFSPPRPDSKRDAHGMAIKLMGVAGEKILDGERTATTQDFVLANSRVFFCRNPSDYVELASKMTDGKFLGFFFPGWNPANWRLREFVNMLRATQRRVDSPLRIQYWSQTPSALGPHAVKLSAQPHASNRRSKVNPQDENYLEQAMTEELSSADAHFDFMVQLQADIDAMPIEDPTILWRERVSPFNVVATIRIPHQQFTSSERKTFAENLSFTPWHSLPAHRPLGGINRVRRATYQAISTFRHQRNGMTVREPEPWFAASMHQAVTARSERTSSMPDHPAQLDVDETRARTAELLGLPIHELDYITEELLEAPLTDGPPPAEETDDDSAVDATVIPNRISYISHIQQSIPMNGRWNIMFYEGCRYNTRYLMWNDQIHRWERNGSCRVPNGNYVPRFKLWWRQ